MGQRPIRSELLLAYKTLGATCDRTRARLRRCLRPVRNGRARCLLCVRSRRIQRWWRSDRDFVQCNRILKRQSFCIQKLCDEFRFGPRRRRRRRVWALTTFRCRSFDHDLAGIRRDRHPNKILGGTQQKLFAEARVHFIQIIKFSQQEFSWPKRPKIAASIVKIPVVLAWILPLGSSRITACIRRSSCSGGQRVGAAKVSFD